MFIFPMFMGHFVGFRMVIRRFVRVRESLGSAAGVAHEDGESSFRTVIVWKHGFGNRFFGFGNSVFLAISTGPSRGNHG